MRLKVIASAGEILVAPLPVRRVSQVVAVGAGPLGWRGPQPGLWLGRLGWAPPPSPHPPAGAAYGLHDPSQVMGIPTCLQAFQSGELWSLSTQYFELINRINTWPIPQKARLTEQEFKVPPCPCPSCQERGRGVALQPPDV